MKRKFRITGMSCAACQSHVYKAVSKLDNIKNINVNLIMNTLECDAPLEIKDEDIINVVKQAGYGASVYAALKNEQISDKRKRNLIL